MTRIKWIKFALKSWQKFACQFFIVYKKKLFMTKHDFSAEPGNVVYIVFNDSLL